MKNLDRLLIVFAVFIVLACRCNSDLFKSRRSTPYPTPYSTPKPINAAPSPNLADLGEYRQCSERQSLKYSNTGGPAPLTINNQGQITISVYRLGANNYQSKYETLTTGKSVTLRSPVRGEWWMITDTAGKCLMIVSPPNTVNIK